MATVSENMGRALDLSFSDVSLYVRNLKGRKKILHSMSGHFPCGKLIGIFGPSGAGKSSLLNILSGWDRHSKITGSIKVNGFERNVEEFKSVSAYITQDSYLNNVLTVEENLFYAADFKLGPSVSQAKKSALIEHVLHSFGLTETRQTRTGNLSGGQRKRLSICLELLSDPDILFLDEPTTGLDFVSTFQCMKYLKKLTEQQKTVVCTLHQPPDTVFELFDMVYVVTDGKCAYQGDAKSLVKFLDDHGVPCGIFHSPLDYMIEIVSGEYGQKALEIVMDGSNNGKNMDYMPADFIENKVYDQSSMEGRNILLKWQNYSLAEDYYELKTLFRREITKLSRDIVLTYLRLASVIFNSVSTGLICYNMGYDATMLYFNYNMVLLQISTLVLCSSMLPAVLFSMYQNVLMNEYQNKYYSIRNYFLTNIILDIPVVFFSSVIGSYLLYWLSGQLMTSERIWMFCCICFQISMVASALGCLIGSIFGLNQAIFIVSSMHIPIFVVSGYGLSIHDMAQHWVYISNIAYTRYAVRSLMGIIFGYDHPFRACPEEETYCHYKDSKKFLDEMGLEDYYFKYDALALCGFYIFIRFLSYVFIRYRLSKGL